MITFICNVSGACCLSVCLFDCGCLILFTVRGDAHYKILTRLTLHKVIQKHLWNFFFFLTAPIKKNWSSNDNNNNNNIWSQRQAMIFFFFPFVCLMLLLFFTMHLTLVACDSLLFPVLTVFVTILSQKSKTVCQKKVIKDFALMQQ